MASTVVAILLLAVVLTEARAPRSSPARKERVEMTVRCGAPPGLAKQEYYLLNPLDRCCQQHDDCMRRIPPKSTCQSTGILNPTRDDILSCQCEKAFHRCLKDENTILSEQVCESYFKKYELRQCLNYDYRRLPGCRIYYEGDDRRMPQRCVSYLYDKTKPMEWALYDLLPCNATFPDLPDNSHAVTVKPTAAPLTRPTLGDVPDASDDEIVTDPTFKKRRMQSSKHRNSARH